MKLPRGLLSSTSPRLALAAVVAVVLAAAAAPLLELALGVSHETADLASRACDAGLPHLLGCDELGRDVLVRLLFAARVSLVVGLGGALVSTLLGAAIGVASAAAGRRVDVITMRVVDALLAVPLLPLLLLTSAMTMGTDPTGTESAWKLVALLGLSGWMGVARIARAETLRIIDLDFVVAARALGGRMTHVLAKHVVPNALPAILVAATIDVGRNILAEAALSFLGLGIQPPTPSWGNMLRHAEDALQAHPGLAFWPGSCILLAVVCVTVLGEALRAAWDPRSSARSR